MSQNTRRTRPFMLLLVTVFCLFQTDSAESANIIAFGDSITAGHSSRSGGYPPKLSSLLNGNGRPSTVVNKGSSGEKTPSGVARFDSVLNSFAANMVLIMEGTNDIRGGLSVQTTQHNLQAMIDKARAKGVIPVLATLTPSNRAGSETLIPNTWNPMIHSLASNNGILLADQYAAILPSWPGANADGLHPNDNGYQIIANTWYNTIAGSISADGSVSDSGGDDDDDGYCFLATAAFGSPVEKHVVLLKEFRNRFLLTNQPGRVFVAAYYRYSPPLADFIREHTALRTGVRIMLYPLIGLSYFLLKLSLPLQLLLGLIALAPMLYVVSRRNNENKGL